jgi:hypothetical protein
MLYVDYSFSLLPNGTIIFDKELKPSLLDVKEDDEFVIKIINERITFVKKPK